MKSNRNNPGMSPAAWLAALLGMLAMGILIQYSDLTVAVPFASEHTLALPAIWVLAALLALGGVFFRLTGWRLLTRAELLCVLFCMLISAPLMSQGFWHRIVAILATHPRLEEFENLDAVNDRLWPHGQNLAAGAFDRENPALAVEGGCAWVTAGETPERGSDPMLVNTSATACSRLTIRLPAGADSRTRAAPGAPYIVSVLARATELAPGARYHCRIYADRGEGVAECFSTAEGAKASFRHPSGFRRVGAYGVKLPAGAESAYFLEFGLQGIGRLELRDPKLCCVTALESAYKGRMLVSEETYRATPPDQRAFLVVKPDRLLSLRGAAFLLSAYIPVRDWAGPVTAWTLFILCVLTAMLAVNAIMRRQWLDNERFQLPMTRIPAALIDDPGDATRALPDIWRNRLMHAGFFLSLAWMLLRVAHAANPAIPDLTVKIQLQDYFQHPSLGRMFHGWRFEIEGVFLPMCIFMELNVLLSLVIGYALFRGQYGLGEAAGWTADPLYPHPEHQTLGAYLGYALILLILSRKYVWGTIRDAVRGRAADAQEDALSCRGAWLLLLGSLAGAVLWAQWMGISPGSMALFAGFLVVMGFVAARIRAECGTPWGYFMPGNLALFLGLLGGARRFGAEAMMFAYMASFMLAPTVFYLIPGAQLELLGLGRRWHVRPRHLLYGALLGVLGGMLIGGWVFLSNAYAMGGDACRYGWAFDTKGWYFFSYNQDLNTATALMNAPAAAAATDPAAWRAFGCAGVVTAGLALLRRFFAAFWFHPVGFLLGGTEFMNYIWGSALMAWVIRMLALRFGGAATVREKIQPFFIGVFLGACTAYLLLMIYAARMHSLGQDFSFGFLTS